MASGHLVANPAWLTTVLADYYPFLQERVPPAWLPKLDDPKAKGGRLTARMKEYGCGAYGCVIPTLDPDVVLKATTDTTETEFAAKFSKELVVPVVVEYFLVVALAARHEGQRVSLLWRESAAKVGELGEGTARYGRALERAVDKQHDRAKKVLLALRDGVRSMDALDAFFAAWVKSLDQMGELPELRYVASGMKRIWLEQKIFISDVHAGNLGLCRRNGKPEWVITDPGNVVVMQ